MCDGTTPRIALITFMVAGSLSPLVAMIGAKLWPKHTVRVAIASLCLFGVAAVASVFIVLC